MKIVSIKANNGIYSIVLEKVCFIQTQKSKDGENRLSVTFYFDNGNFLDAPSLAVEDVDNLIKTMGEI